MRTTDRIQHLLDPAYGADLSGRALDDLRAMKAEGADVETVVSYYRRLAQARIEILEAEQARRGRGGSVEDLIADLPRILGAEGGRSSAANARVVAPDTPAFELHWPDGRERLVADETLANLPQLSGDELSATINDLRAFERELSDVRQRLHGVLDGIEHEIATRQAAGTAR